jgi:NTE family protein
VTRRDPARDPAPALPVTAGPLCYDFGRLAWRRGRSMFLRAYLTAVIVSAALLLAGPAPAQTVATMPAPDVAAAAARPRIRLVLSGGGARGAAHIGALKVIEQLCVPVDAIAGTSMGAVVGSLYASGMSAAEIQHLIGLLDGQDAFRDRPPRATLNIRRKQDDREFLVRAPIGLRGGTLRFPRGLVQGQKLNEMLRAATLRVAGIEDFDRLLVDGGLAENLPIDLVRAMGVDVIIAVDLSSPLPPGQELDSALAVSNQMSSILINRETDRSRQALGARELIIEPDLGSMFSGDFARVHEAIDAGEAAAQRASRALAAWAVSAHDYERFLPRGRPPPPLPIDFVRVANDSGDYHKFIAAALDPLVGQPADPQTIAPAIRALYGRDLFETLDYHLLQDGEQSGLEVSARRKSWGPNCLRFGLDLQDDFEGNNNFTAGVRFVVTEFNPYMAEWNIDLNVGEQPMVGAEFYQPLGEASPRFLAARFSFGSRSIRLRDGGRLLGEYRVHETNFGIDFGREFSDWGEIRAGLRRVTGSTRLRVGEPTAQLPESTSFRQGGLYTRLSSDRLDSVDVPRHGELVTLEWDAQRAQLGADHDADMARLDWLVARLRDRNTLVFWTSAGSALSGAPGVQGYSPLGGFLNLSGLTAASLGGPHFGIARLIYLRKIGSGADGLFSVPTYIGLAAEAGNVWQRRGDASFASVHRDSAAFVGR